MTAKTAVFDYPVFLNLVDQQVVVVGAGSVGLRKVQRLSEAGAKVRLVDPVLAEEEFSDKRIEIIPSNFDEQHLKGALLVFACTNSSETNGKVAAAAKERQIFCCRADEGEAGDFIVPAILERDNLKIAVSTGGNSPLFAKEVCRQLDQYVPDGWGFSLEVISKIRRKMLTEKIDDKYNQQVLRSFMVNQLLPLAEQNKFSEINRLLVETYGREFSLEQLKVKLSEGIS